MEGQHEVKKRSGPDEWPAELLHKIFGQLSLFDLSNVSNVCERWKQIALRTGTSLIVNKGNIAHLLASLERSDFAPLIVNLDVRGLDCEETRAFMPLLQKCVNLKTLSFANSFFASNEDKRIFWETITYFRGTLKNLKLSGLNFFYDDVKFFPRPINMITGLEKLAFDDCIFKELIVANKDTLREICAVNVDEDVMNLIADCARLDELSITQNETGIKLLKYIRPSTALNFTYVDRLYLRKVNDYCPHVTKFIAHFPENYELESWSKLTHLPNVTELHLTYYEMHENHAQHAIRFASHFHKLRVLIIDLVFDENELGEYLFAFNSLPTLKKIILTYRYSPLFNHPELSAWVEVAENFKNRGYDASYIHSDSNNHMIIYRPTDDVLIENMAARVRDMIESLDLSS